jgi:hypothetical protein
MMIELLSMNWYPNRDIRRTHKPPEAVAVAVADSQADHHSPAGTPAEVAEDSSLDQVVPLMTVTLVNDTEATITSTKSHLEGDNIAAVVDLDCSNLC